MGCDGAAAAILLLAVVGTILGRGSSTKLDPVSASLDASLPIPGMSRSRRYLRTATKWLSLGTEGRGVGRYIYVLQIGGQTPLQITHHDSTESAEDGFPAWSPGRLPNRVPPPV